MRGWGARGVFVALLALGASVAVASSTTARSAAASEGLSYVAMGDSYTSGPLVLPHDTTWVPQDCGQSVRNYPHLVAPAIGATSFVDVSCGGATINDLYKTQVAPAGGMNAAQLDAVGPDTDVVTLGMGGNDIGFVGLALGCIRAAGPPVQQPCSPAYTAGGTDQVSDDIAEVGPELGQALRDIHAKAPHAAVFVVSYPTALPDDGQACWPYVPILPADMPYLVAKFKEMNAMLAAEAAANDATYIDIYTPSIGHDACQIPTVAWVNGLVVVPPSFPAHPNGIGLAHSAAFVAAAIQARLTATSATTTTTTAPVAVEGSTAAAATAGSGDTLPATGADDRTMLVAVLLLAGVAGASVRRRAR